MSQTQVLSPYRIKKIPNQPAIAYLEAGPANGPVILFLHGLGDSALIWSQSVAALQTDYRCIAIDLPGHGNSSADAFNYKMYAYADAVAAFIKSLNLRSFSLVGHSMGGQISIILSLRFPALINKLALVAPAGFEQFTEYEKKMLKLGASFGNGWNLPGGQQNTDAATRQLTLQKSMEGMLSEPIYDFLPQLTVPTLVIFGDQDAFIPNRYLHHTQTSAAIAREGASLIPEAELQLFNRCSHYPQTEHPELFVNSIVEFLKKGL